MPANVDPQTADHGDVVEAPHPIESDLVESDLLVAEVSIDGMCGVY